MCLFFRPQRNLGAPYSWMTVAAKANTLKESLHLWKWNPTFLVHRTSPLNAGSIGFEDAVAHIPKINSPQGVGQRPQFQRGRDPEPSGDHQDTQWLKGLKYSLPHKWITPWAAGEWPQRSIGKRFKSRYNEIGVLMSVTLLHLHISGAKLPKCLCHYHHFPSEFLLKNPIFWAFHHQKPTRSPFSCDTLNAYLWLQTGFSLLPLHSVSIQKWLWHCQRQTFKCKECCRYRHPSRLTNKTSNIDTSCP